MAEETTNTIGTEPPKANPLANPAAPHASTLSLKPVVRSAVKPGVGATQTALRPGLKLPAKPGLPTGLKLPPKAGATVSGLKPGVRLPTQSGLKPGIKLPTQSGLKPGIKLPTRPAIHKPGATLKAPVPVISKPVAPATAPQAPTLATVAPVAPTPAPAPVAPAPTPVAPAPTAVAAPAPTAVAAPAAAPAPTVTAAPATSEPPKPLEALKAVTQNLKNITAPIPQQAILRKTGIIADAEMTEAQKQAAKSKTARISLSDAMGVAPVKNEALPMKTIRIKRPADIPGAVNPTATAKPLAPAAPESKPVDSQAVTKPADEAPSTATSFTQRKTLKISRPGSGIVRPAGKFGVKKPTTAAAPTASAAAPAPAGTPPDVADIPDMPVADLPPPPVAPVPANNQVPNVSKGMLTIGIAIQAAACVAIAFLAWLLFQNTQLPMYCGGCL